MEFDAPTLVRLNQLMAVGYRIDQATSQKVLDAVWLDHPARNRAEEPTLILYPNGLLVSGSVRDASHPELRIQPDESQRFTSFLSRVPKATLWERSRNGRFTAAAYISIAVLYGALLALWNVVSWLFRGE